ncbi:MAG: M23 family metallopeptidase [Armatimonadota bacterium]|nr:M23 family metallopeptidase [Armatimonadota bacterium]MDR7423042.1 M23 family metallopeptidase [Armatimonadota bacterium]MDR7454334.1 M23 family metallopeptidase [Armatimonadota bacterium]MDR7512283.1 M23 family metallopeptidase [Armatimonadota bacterium]
MTPARWVLLATVLLAGVPAQAAPASIRITIPRDVVAQGEALDVTVVIHGGAERAQLRFAGRTFRLYPAGRGVWRTIVGTDPITAPGAHAIVVEAASPQGAWVSGRVPVRVRKVTFPTRRLAFDPERRALLRPEVAARERERVNAALRVLHPSPLWDGPFARPVEAPVSSPYGVLSIYHGQVRGFHTGTDFAAPEGTPVYAAAAGIVRLAEELPLSGRAVLVDHGLGIITSYLHLSSITAQVGQRVRRGDLVGHVGSTGLATGPHLHWGMRANGVRVDPMPWIAP